MTLQNRLQSVRRVLGAANELAPHIVALQVAASVLAALRNVLGVLFLGTMVTLISTATDMAAAGKMVVLFVSGLLVLTIIQDLLATMVRTNSRLLNTNAQTRLAQHLLMVDYATYASGKFHEDYATVKAGLQYTGAFQQFIGDIINQLVILSTTVILTGFASLRAVGRIMTVHRTGGTTVSSLVYVALLLLLIILPLVTARIFAAKAGQSMDQFFAFNLDYNRRLDYYTENLFVRDAVNKLLRIFDPRAVFINKADSEITKGTDRDTELQVQAARYASIPFVVTNVVVGALYAVTALQALAGLVTAGEAVAAVGLIQLIIAALSELLGAWGNRAASLQVVNNYMAFMQQGVSSSADVRIEKQVAWGGDSSIIFEHVSFRYPGQNRDALHDINLTIRTGQHLAIIGPNGSGKSTFIKLLIGLLRPTAGTIYLDGTATTSFDETQYQQLFAVVAQQFQIFATSLNTNVQMAAAPDAAKMAAVLQQTHLQARFPDAEMNAKVDLTRDVDPHGTSLSGGEAQRVAIARALYRNAPILVLDEPTAALDPVAEAEVFAQFDAMSRQKTVLLVSHRMSATLMSQDIVIFAKGGIVDEGTHQDLYQRSALYRKMYDAQAQYYVQQ